MQAVSFLRTGVDPRVKIRSPPASKPMEPMGSKILAVHVTKKVVEPPASTYYRNSTYHKVLSKFKPTTSGQNVTLVLKKK